VTTNVSTGPSPLDPNAPPPRRSARLGVLLTLVMTIGLLYLLFSRSILAPVPSSKLIVRADSTWEGARLTVEGPSISSPRVTHIEKFGNYAVPFFLPPGMYTLHVNSHDEEVYTCQVDLLKDQVEEIDLLESGATTRPAPASAAIAEGKP
jgi:hypothetical protein